MTCLRALGRQCRVTPDRLIAALFIVEALLFLSDRFGWFGLSRHKGWAVLISLASVIAVIAMLPIWTVMARVLRWRVKYSIRSLLALTLAASLACSWLAVEIRKASEQTTLIEMIGELGGDVDFDYREEMTFWGQDDMRLAARPAAWAWLRELLGDDFFAVVTSVSFEGPMVTDASLDRLDLCRLSQLKSIFICSPGVTDAGLVRLKGLSHLQDLILCHTNVTDAGLAQLRGLTQLQRLDLRHTRVDGTGFDHLTDLTQLDHLALDFTKVTDAGLEDVARLRQLLGLGLAGTEVTDVGLAHVKGLSQLQTLDLAGTEVTDAGLENLGVLSRIEDLNLSTTKVTDAGLGCLKAFPQLKSLGLSFTKVTDAGLECLKVLPQLRVVDVDFTNVSGEGIQKFERDRPECQIGHCGRFPEKPRSELKREVMDRYN